MSYKTIAKKLWDHRNGLGCGQTDKGKFWTITKGSQILALNHERDFHDEDHIWEKDAYYLDCDGIYVYKVESAADIEEVLKGNGNNFLYL